MANDERAEHRRPWGRGWSPPSRPTHATKENSTPGDTDVLPSRIAAHLLDWAFMVVAGGFGLYGLGFISAAAANSVAVLLLLVGLSWVVLQGLTGWSVGKLLTRLRVVGEDGAVPGVRAALVRTLPLVIEQIGVIGLIAAARSPAHQRFGDRWARTYVVRAPRERASERSDRSPSLASH